MQNIFSFTAIDDPTGDIATAYTEKHLGSADEMRNFTSMTPGLVEVSYFFLFDVFLFVNWESTMFITDVERSFHQRGDVSICSSEFQEPTSRHVLLLVRLQCKTQSFYLFLLRSKHTNSTRCLSRRWAHLPLGFSFWWFWHSTQCKWAQTFRQNDSSLDQFCNLSVRNAI